MKQLTEQEQSMAEGIDFAKKMDRVIEHISDAIESKPELKRESMHVLVPCFVSMAAQMSLEMALTKDQWLELAEMTYREHGKINEQNRTH